MTDDKAKALTLLNSILATSQPAQTVRLTRAEAELLGRLGRRELGALAGRISKVGVVDGLEKHGLFGRAVIVVER
jgi:hypothetical protein